MTEMSEFERGARAAAEAMRFYFVDENEVAMYAVTESELEDFEDGAVADVLRLEALRLGDLGVVSADERAARAVVRATAAGRRWLLSDPPGFGPGASS